MNETENTLDFLARLRQIAIDGALLLGVVLLLASEFPRI